MGRYSHFRLGCPDFDRRVGGYMDTGEGVGMGVREAQPQGSAYGQFCSHFQGAPSSPTPGCGLLHLSIPYTFSACAENLRGGFYPSIASPRKPLLTSNREFTQSSRDIGNAFLVTGWKGVFMAHSRLGTG